MATKATTPPLAIWRLHTGVAPDLVARFCQKWGVSKLALFGSVVRDDFHADSDIDVLVYLDQSKPHGGWDWIGMIDELQVMFGRKVHLTSPKILDNRFRRQEIMRDLQVVYAA